VITSDLSVYADSLSYYRAMRTGLKEMLATFDAAHDQRVMIFRTTELAELAYLSLRDRASIAGGS
jgi:hypothetical protein